MSEEEVVQDHLRARTSRRLAASAYTVCPAVTKLQLSILIMPHPLLQKLVVGSSGPKYFTAPCATAQDKVQLSSDININSTDIRKQAKAPARAKVNRRSGF